MNHHLILEKKNPPSVSTCPSTSPRILPILSTMVLVRSLPALLGQLTLLTACARYATAQETAEASNLVDIEVDVDGVLDVEVGLARRYAPYESTHYVPSADGLPDKTQEGQSGTNKCGTKSSDSALCQNLYLAGPTDWCLYAPPTKGNVSDFEADVVSYCTKGGRGTRLIPPGTISGMSFVYAPGYVQVTGTGDFTKMNILPGDEGGELDAHGADDLGNPKGDIVFIKDEAGKWQQAHQWAMFMADKEFCVRACYDGPDAWSLCRHTFDELGCAWNMPAHYPTDTFEVCHTENAQDIAFYDGKEYHQKDGPAPDPHPAPKYLGCQPIQEKDLYGQISAGAFTNGNATYTPYSGALDHSSPANAGGVAVNNSGTNAGAQVGTHAAGASNGSASGSGAMGASNNKGSSGSSSSTQKPTSTNAAVSVETSRQIGVAFVALVTALLAGCMFL